MAELLPILTVAKIEVDNIGDRVLAALEIGGRSCAATLGFGRSPGIEIISMPDELQYHEAATKAVLDVMSKAYRGETVSTPLDLSPIVRSTFEVWPTKVTACDSASAKRLPFVLVGARSIAVGIFVLGFEVRGTASVVAVDIRDGNRSYFRFVRGVHPWHLERDDVGAYVWHVAAAIKGPADAQAGEAAWPRQEFATSDSECMELLASSRPSGR